MTDDLVKIKVDLSLLQREIETVKEPISKLDGLEKRLAELEKTANVVFFKDRRFWAGVLALPLLIAGGWTVDKVIGQPVLLSMIHHAFGTQPVILSAIETKNDPLQNGLNQTVLQLLKGDNVLKPEISEEISRRFGIVHSDIIEVGLNKPDQISLGDCKDIQVASSVWGQKTPLTSPNRKCESLDLATTRFATSVFGLQNYDTVDVDIGIFVSQFPRKADGELDLTNLTEVPSPPPYDQLISVKIDDTAISLPSPINWSSRTIRNRSMKLAYMHFPGVKLPAAYANLPLHTLAVSLTPKAPDNYIISVAAIISVPHQN